MKKYLFSITLAILLFAIPTQAKFIKDIIVTSPDAIWTDSRAYATLQDAITAIGANEREIVVAKEEVCTALTIPANVHLKFTRAGSITNSGQLTINTQNIFAGEYQIFTGAGDIDFASGSIVRSTWFSDLDEAFDVTSDDTLVMIISESATTNANMVVGDNVILRWESPFTITVDAGHIVSNLKNIEAGHYQIFAGAGDFDFLDGTGLRLDWFIRLRNLLTWVETEKVTVIISGTNTVSFDDTVPSNICLDFLSEKGILSIDGGVTLTVEGTVFTESVNVFIGAGTVDYSAASFIKPSPLDYTRLPSNASYVSTYANDFDVAVADIGATETTLIIDSDCEMSVNTVTPTTLSIEVLNGCLIDIGVNDLTINGPFNAGLYQAFSLSGSVSFGNEAVAEIYPEWWGVVGDGSTDSTIPMQRTLDSISAYGGKVVISSDTSYIKLTDELTCYSDTHIVGLGMPEIRQTTAEKKIFKGTSLNDIIIEGLYLKGRGAQQVYVTDEDIIRFDTCDNIVLRDLLIKDVRGAYGVCFKTSTNILIEKCKIDTYSYAGIAFLGAVENVYAVRNYVKNCVNTTHSNPYGIMHGDESLPYTFGKNIYYLYNIIEDNPRWEGLDVHGGENIYIIGNIIKNCRTGIMTGLAWTQVSNVFKNVHILDNNIECASTDYYAGTANTGIYVIGAIDSGNYYYGENITIRGNHVKYGNKLLSSNNNGGITVYIVKDITISNNNIYRNKNAGITLYHRVKRFSINNNIFTDNYGGTFEIGLSLRSVEIEDGVIEGNIFTDITGSGFEQKYGISVDVATSRVLERNNVANVSTSKYLGHNKIKNEFANAAPAAGNWERGDVVLDITPTAGATPGWVCVTAGTPGTWKAMSNLAP